MSLRNVRFYDPADAGRPAGNIAGTAALSSDMSIATHRRRHRVDHNSRESSRVILALADAADRQRIYQLRHDVYASELGQHHVNDAGLLSDALADQNVYLVARVDGQIAGFISITPPTAGTYSIDKYARREQLPFPVDEGLYEV